MLTSHSRLWPRRSLIVNLILKMGKFGWRLRLCTMAFGLAVYLVISAFVSVNNIQGTGGQLQRAVPGTGGDLEDKLASSQQIIQAAAASAPQQAAAAAAASPRMGQPRNLAAVVARSQRMTPRRIRSRLGPVIDWCQPQGFKAAAGPTVALASFPGSGNTWLRYLIQQATGRNHAAKRFDIAIITLCSIPKKESRLINLFGKVFF